MDVRNIAAIRVLGQIVTEGFVVAHSTDNHGKRMALSALTMALMDFGAPTWQEALDGWGLSLDMLRTHRQPELVAVVEECVDIVIAAAEGKGKALSGMRKLLRDIGIETGGPT
jgi:hypothetical protein